MADDIIKLWFHEINRVFSDRLINEKDKDIVTSILADHSINILKSEKCDCHKKEFIHEAYFTHIYNSDDEK